MGHASKVSSTRSTPKRDRAARRPRFATGLVTGRRALRRAVTVAAVGAILIGLASCSLFDSGSSDSAGASASWDVDDDGTGDALVWTEAGAPAVLSGSDTSAQNGSGQGNNSGKGNDSAKPEVGKPIPKAPILPSVGSHPATGDFDADGHGDLALCRASKKDSGSLVIMFGGEDGLSTKTEVGAFPNLDITEVMRHGSPPWCPELAAADVNGDGVDDLVTAGRQLMAWAEGSPDIRDAESWDFNRIATKKDRPEDTDTAYDFRNLELGDINGDGHLDIAAILHSTIAGDAMETSRGKIWLGSPDGFEQHSAKKLFSDGRFLLGDVNGDDHDDLFLPREGAIRYGSDNGLDLTGAVDAKVPNVGEKLSGNLAHLDVTSREMADVDADGIDDLVLLLGDSDQWLHSGHALVLTGSEHGLSRKNLSMISGRRVGTGSGGEGVNYSNEVAPYAQNGVRVTDVTGDGGSDLVLARGGTTQNNSRTHHSWTTYLLESDSLRDMEKDTKPKPRPEPDTTAADPWDINGDGIADLVVGATDKVFEEPGHEDGPRGALAVLRGVEDDMPEPWQVIDRQDRHGIPKRLFEKFPYGITSGDYNSDGHADVAACGGDEGGVVTILAGSADGLSDGFTLDPVVAGQCSALRSADVNSDGYADLLNESGPVLGLGGPDAVSNSEGWQFVERTRHPFPSVLFGDWNGDDRPDGAASFGYRGGIANPRADDLSLAWEPLAIGDLNDDGYDDLVTMIPDKDHLWLWHGSEKGLPNEPERLSYEALRPEAPAPFPYSASIGDMDGDGYPELAFGDENVNTNDQWDAGSALVVPGSADGPVLSDPELLHQDTEGYPGKAQEYDLFGSTVRHLDVNGDGRDELLVGSPGEDDGVGAIHVIGQDETTRLYPKDVGIDEGTVGFGLHRAQDDSLPN